VSADRHHKPEDLTKQQIAQLTAAEWKRFKQKLHVDKVFVEYTVE